MTANDVTICQEALALVRQETKLDATRMTAAAGSADALARTKAEEACCRVYDYARRAFLAAHDWSFARTRQTVAFTNGVGAKPGAAIRVVAVEDAQGADAAWSSEGANLRSGTTSASYSVVYTSDVSDVSAWPALARAAFVMFLARELALPVTGRMDDLKAMDALARERVAAAYLADLREGSAADGAAEEVLALLKSSATLTAEAEADCAEAALRRLPVFLKAAEDEVKAAHDWELTQAAPNLPDCAEAAAVVLAAHKIAVKVGAGADSAKYLWELYERKLASARVRHLHGKISSNTDPVLAELLANFRADDAGLARAWSVYTARKTAVASLAEAEVAAAHDWPTLTNDQGAAGLTALKAAAERERTLEMLSTACGAGAGEAQRHARNFAERLRAARVYALEREPMDDDLGRQVASFLRPMLSLPSFALPRSIASRVAELREAARKEVETAHRWNFLRTSEPACSVPLSGEGLHLAQRPPDAVLVEAVYGPDGGLCDWSMRGDDIVTKGAPAAEVVYIRDEEDLLLWPDRAVRALALLVAAEIAAQGGDDRLMEEYRRTLSRASVADAREGNPGRAAWGRGAFAAAMGGRGAPLRAGRAPERGWPRC